ncbi:response regulator [Sphaerisporangium fuscum]|uniref:response regulator n=1 Tax=Sphaerisporangium fuscum TaxID=2835868 RepID=UPI001BDDA260|nr:response regulator [Sphaerisporangium fuscum]
MPLSCLIVDDNDHFLQVARQVLERGGIAVVGVSSTTSDAMRRFEESRPDVALVDIDLGDENGFDLARRFSEAAGRSAGGTCSRVILMSAHLGDDFAELIADSPAVAFLPKTDLSARIIHDILGENDFGSPAGLS